MKVNLEIANKHITHLSPEMFQLNQALDRNQWSEDETEVKRVCRMGKGRRELHK